MLKTENPESNPSPLLSPTHHTRSGCHQKRQREGEEVGESADLDTLGVLSRASRIVYLIPSRQGRGRKQRGKFMVFESGVCGLLRWLAM